MQFPLFEYVRGRVWKHRASGHDAASDAGGATATGQELQKQMQHATVSSEGIKSALVETGLVTGGSAAVSGAIAAFVTTPLDVVKTRMMLAVGDEPPPPSSKHDVASCSKSQRPQEKNVGGFAIAKSIFREKGTRGLFRGATLRASWTAIGSGLYLGSYEVAKIWLKRTEAAEMGS